MVDILYVPSLRRARAFVSVASLKRDTRGCMFCPASTCPGKTPVPVVLRNCLSFGFNELNQTGEM